jgi:hypothetical protein
MVRISNPCNNGIVRIGGVISSEKSHANVCHGSFVSGYGFGYGSVTVLGTITNLCQSVSFTTLAGEVLEFMRVA